MDRVHFGEQLDLDNQGFAVRDRRFKKPLRYPGHDYRAPCSVHVTICTWNHQCLFGTVTANGVRLNDAGHFVTRALLRLHAPGIGIVLDTHIVMPDHLHAIIHLGTEPRVTTTTSIPELVHGFKTRVVRSWPGGVQNRHWRRYDTHLWQLSYYDTLIRNDRHLETARQYILDNPDRWIARHSP